MNANAAREILRTNNLIDRKTSKKILSDITNDMDVDVRDIACPILRQQIKLLQHEYRDRVQALGGRPQPRNRPFYEMIQEQYSQFRWEPSNSKNVKIDFYGHGIKPSLLSLLLSLIPEQATSAHRRLHKRFNAQDAAVLSPFLDVFEREGGVTPSDADLTRLVCWIRLGQAGQQVSIVSPVCPDYETVPGSNAAHRYTFNALGDGVGVTAARLLAALPALHHLFRETLGLQQLAHFVCPGDFEAFSPATLQRLDLTEATFLGRVSESCRAIARESPVPVIARPFTDLCGGKAGWRIRHAAITARFQAGKFGPLRDNPLFQAIARSRQPLYERWYAVRDKPLRYYEDLVVNQGTEYTTMGAIVTENGELGNTLVLGADHHRMAVFYTFAAEALPVLSLRHNYE